MAEGRQPIVNRSARRRAVVIAIAVLVIGGGLCAFPCRGAVRRFFGPPAVKMAEKYPPNTEGPVFDHGLLDGLLRKHVRPGGWIDYEKLGEESETLDGYLGALAGAPFEDLGRNQKLALLINAYNAFTLRLILDHYPVGSIKDIPAGRRWDDSRWRIGSHTWSLNQIEHEQVRPHFKEPRIHFALVCAAVGCPPLRPEAYVADRLEAQLDEQSRIVHGSDRWFRYETESNLVRLTTLYDWYGGDFEQAAGSVLEFAARYSPPLAEALDQGRESKIRWLDYDWGLNGMEE